MQNAVNRSQAKVPFKRSSADEQARIADAIQKGPQAIEAELRSIAQKFESETSLAERLRLASATLLLDQALTRTHDNVERER